MNKEKLHIKNLIAENQLDKAFLLLSQYLENQLSGHNDPYLNNAFNEVILFNGKYKSIKEEKRLGIISNENEKLELNVLTHSCLELIDELPENLFVKKEPTNEVKSEIAAKLDKIEHIRKKSNYKYDLFVTHSSIDLKEAQHIYQKLRGYGLKVFVSSEVLKQNIGFSFFEEIQEALSNSQHMMIICSANAMNSEWVKLEYETFFNEFHLKNRDERKILILKGKGCDLSTIPILLRRVQIASSVDEIINSLILFQEQQLPQHKITLDDKAAHLSDKKPKSKINRSRNNLFSKIMNWLKEDTFDWKLYKLYFFLYVLLLIISRNIFLLSSLLAPISLILWKTNAAKGKFRMYCKYFFLAWLPIFLVVILFGLVIYFING